MPTVRRTPHPPDARAAMSRPSAPPWLRDLAGAWIFYSVLPAWPRPRPRFARIARFAPWIGVVLALPQALLWELLQGRAPQLVQVSLVLAAGLVLSGGLHMDGAMDTADGLAAGEQRRLEAMADTRVGAMGAQTLALLLLLRAAGLAALGPMAPPLLIWAAVWARVAPLPAMALFPYLGAATLAWAGPAGPWLLLAGVAGGVPALVVPLWLGRRLGGHSGDSYGACVEWTDAAALLLGALVMGVGAAWLAAPGGPAG